jgi:IS30 family transposase
MGIIIKYRNKNKKTVPEIHKKLQEQGILQYKKNIFSITPDNGIEFSDGVAMTKSILGSEFDIIAYYCLPYHS